MGSGSSSVYFPSKYHSDSFYNTEERKDSYISVKVTYRGSVLTKSLMAFLACESGFSTERWF